MTGVSVIITAYNVARYVEEAVQSALAQRYAQREVIVVDDASTDATPQILASFGGAIRIVRHDRNAGVMQATISGIDAAKYGILSFLDGDDVWEREKLSLVAAAFRETPAAVLVSHDYSIIDAEGRTIRRDDGTQQLLRSAVRDSTAADVSALMTNSILRYEGRVWLGSAYSIRRSAIDMRRLREHLRNQGDSELVYQDHPLATFAVVTNPCDPLAYIPEKLLRYRVHDANYSGAAFDAERAKRIVGKGIATTRLTSSLVIEYRPDDVAAVAAQAGKLREFEFLQLLYDRRPRAIVRLAQCINRWSPSRSLKETLRFLLVMLIGPRLFLRLNRLRRRRTDR